MMKNRLISFVIIFAVTMLAGGCATTGAKMAGQADAKGKNTKISTGDFFEDCDKWKPGSKVNIGFTSSKPVVFNVHFHNKTTREKVYAVPQTVTDSYNGSITVESDAIYCGQWQNNNSKYVDLNFYMSMEKQ